MSRASPVEHAITVDEIGIVTGRYREFLLKTAYQPVFRRFGASLKPFAVEGLIRPFVEGQPVPVLSLFQAAPPQDRLFLETLCGTLHFRNHHNIGVPGLELFFNFDPRVHADIGKSIEQIRGLPDRLAELGLESRLLICEITESAALDRETLVRLAAEFRRQGIRLAIDDFGAGHSTLERVDLIEPEIIKIDGPWFRQVANEPSAARLLVSLIEGFHSRGVEVLVEGIETPFHLTVALDAGADFVQGFLLARPALAGTVFDQSPVSIARLLARDRKVVRLFAGGRHG